MFFLVDAWVSVDRSPKLTPGVVDDLLHIMASSMLVVSTFVLPVLASASSSASSVGTPRATRLVVAKPHSQKAVAVFLAALIFSVMGVIALCTGLFGASGRLVSSSARWRYWPGSLCRSCGTSMSCPALVW